MPRLSGMGAKDAAAPEGKKPKKVRRRDTPPSAHHLTLGSICRHGLCEPKTATNVWLREPLLRERIAKALDRVVAEFLMEHPLRKPPDNGGAPTQFPGPAQPLASPPPTSPPGPPKKEEPRLPWA